MPSWILVRVRRHDGHHDALYCRDVWNRDPGNVGSVRMYQLPSRLLCQWTSLWATSDADLLVVPEFWYERDLVAAGMPARILRKVHGDCPNRRLSWVCYCTVPNWDDFVPVVPLPCWYV